MTVIGELLSPSRLLEMMEGNRRLTLRTIEAFPEERLFSFSPAEPLRPFSEMAIEILNLEEAYLRGIMTGEWHYGSDRVISTRDELLAAMTRVREQTRAWWPELTVERLLTVEPDHLFGGPPASFFSLLFYALENEIHHRGQGMVYLRQLGVEPPPFWER